MFERLYGIEVEGACFTSPTKIDLFDKEKHRLSVIFGRNGVGKSTLARAVAGVSPESLTSQLRASFYDKDGVVLANSSAKKVFVFNEDFVDDNVKVAQGGITAVLLLGEQKGLGDEVESCEKDILKLNESLSKSNEELKKIDEGKVEGTPKFCFEEIKRTLNVSGWVARERKIRGERYGSVGESLVNKIASLVLLPEENFDALNELFEKQRFLYEKSKDLPSVMTRPLPVFNVAEGIDERIVNCLRTKLEKQELTDREKEIIALIENTERDVDDVQRCFSSQNFNICPYCFQAISESYRSDVLKNLDKIINREVDEFRSNLSKIKIDAFSGSLLDYLEIDPELVRRAEEVLKECRNASSEYRERLEQKQSMLFFVD